VKTITRLAMMIIVILGFYGLYTEVKAADILGGYPDYLVFAYPNQDVEGWKELHCLTSSNYLKEGNILYIGETIPCWYDGGEKTDCLVIESDDDLSCKELDLLF